MSLLYALHFVLLKLLEARLRTRPARRVLWTHSCRSALFCEYTQLATFRFGRALKTECTLCKCTCLLDRDIRVPVSCRSLCLLCVLWNLFRFLFHCDIWKERKLCLFLCTLHSPCNLFYVLMRIFFKLLSLILHFKADVSGTSPFSFLGFLRPYCFVFFTSHCLECLSVQVVCGGLEGEHYCSKYFPWEVLWKTRVHRCYLSQLATHVWLYFGGPASFDSSW